MAIEITIEILKMILPQILEKETTIDINNRIETLNAMRNGIFEKPKIIEEYEVQIF